MDPCEAKSEFISLFLFENGVACQPERLRVRRAEVDKYFQRNGKTYCYQGKTIYSCCGESVCKFSSDLPENAAFVLVPSHEKFIEADYEAAFEKLLKKTEFNRRKLEEQRRTRSTASVCAGEEDHCGPRKSKKSSSDHKNLSGTRTFKPHCDSDFEPEPSCESIAMSKPKTRPSCESVPSCKPKAPPPPSRGSKSGCDFKPKRSSCDSGPSCESVSSCKPKPRPGFQSKSRMSCETKPKRSSCDSKPARSTCETSRPASNESRRSSCSTSASVRGRPSSCERKPESKRSSCLKSPSNRYDCGEGRRPGGPNKSSARSRCVSEDKYPCDESDDDESSGKDSKSKKRNDGCGPLFMSDVAPKKKKGLAAKLCPCFVKPKSKPSCIRLNAKDAQVCENDKCTQTSGDDFKVAMKCMKAEQKLERQRQKMYNRKQKKNEKLTCADAKAMREEGIDCPDDVDPAKREVDYKKARDKYREKRKRLEDTINRAMEKERKRNLKIGCP